MHYVLSGFLCCKIIKCMMVHIKSSQFVNTKYILIAYCGHMPTMFIQQDLTLAGTSHGTVSEGNCSALQGELHCNPLDIVYRYQISSALWERVQACVTSSRDQHGDIPLSHQDEFWSTMIFYAMYARFPLFSGVSQTKSLKLN